MFSLKITEECLVAPFNFQPLFNSQHWRVPCRYQNVNQHHEQQCWTNSSAHFHHQNSTLRHCPTRHKVSAAKFETHWACPSKCKRGHDSTCNKITCELNVLLMQQSLLLNRRLVSTAIITTARIAKKMVHAITIKTGTKQSHQTTIYNKLNINCTCKHYLSFCSSKCMQNPSQTKNTRSRAAELRLLANTVCLHRARCKKTQTIEQHVHNTNNSY